MPGARQCGMPATPTPLFPVDPRRDRNQRHPRAGRGRTERQQGVDRGSPALRHTRQFAARRRQGAPAGLARHAHHARGRAGTQGPAAPQPGHEPRRCDRTAAGAGRQRGGGASHAPRDHARPTVRGSAGWRARASARRSRACAGGCRTEGVAGGYGSAGSALLDPQAFPCRRPPATPALRHPCGS